MKYSVAVTASTTGILRWLRERGDPVNVAGMARFGIRPATAYGVAMPAIRSLAKEIGRDHALALRLWDTGVHEARMLSTLLADPKRLTEAEVEKWVRDFDSWAICDSACLALLWKTPFAWRKVREWSRRESEFERRAAFALIAALSVHDRKSPDEPFLSALKIIEKTALDERNFVKKAVNWALRQVGKRNLALHSAALETAETLISSPSRAPRWIGAGALRELKSDEVVERLRQKEANRTQQERRLKSPPRRQT